MEEEKKNIASISFAKAAFKQRVVRKRTPNVGDQSRFDSLLY